MRKSWTLMKRRWLSYLFAYSAKAAMRLIMRTCRVEIQGLDKFVAAAQQHPCILMLWHNRLVVISEVLNAFAPQFIYTAFISKSRDGEPLALLAQSYKSGRALRVPHNGRHRALNQMIDRLKIKREIMLITPDGPRGPRYEIKPGIVMAARESAAKVIPFSWNGSRVWTLNTWDGMLVPKPFSTIKVTFGESLFFEKGDTAAFAEEKALLRTALLNLEAASKGQ
jgi:lysophospholipid acyltransferase (LPLAT)-like uncharacterized protein